MDGVPENYSSSEMLIILIKIQAFCINSNNFACKFIHINIVSKKANINIIENPTYCHHYFSSSLLFTFFPASSFSYSKHIQNNSENIDLQVDSVLSAI